MDMQWRQLSSEARTDAAGITFYVINLDRTPERWRFMREMCTERGLRVRRLPAVDGRLFRPEDVDALAPARPGFRRLSAGEVACFESHKAAWQRIAEGDAPFGGVLEDDVYLAPDFAEQCAHLAASLPSADLIKLNSYEKRVNLHRHPVLRLGRHRVHRLAQATIDGSAYLISREFAAEALERFRTYEKELDVALFDPALFNVVQVVPALSVQEKFAAFRFLCGTAAESQLELTRAQEQARLKAERKQEKPHRTLWGKAKAEARRFVRRRVQPKWQALVNLTRPKDQQLAMRIVEFSDRIGGRS